MTDNTDGFSTLEVLIAFSILSLSIALSVASYSQGLSGLKEAQARLTAMSLLGELEFSRPFELQPKKTSKDDFRLSATLETIAVKPFSGLIPKRMIVRMYNDDGAQLPLVELDTVILLPEPAP